MILFLFVPLGVGLILFLFGLSLMRYGLEQLSSDKWKKKITLIAKTPPRGLLAGTLITMLLQSSSAVTILIVGFVNARLLTFYESIGLILGANIGTTITLQMLALPMEELILPLLVLGLTLWMIPHSTLRRIGLSIGGLSLMLLSLSIMGTGGGRLLTSGTIASSLRYIGENPFAALTVGLVATALIQSSTSVLSMTIIFLKHQAISLPTGVAILLGSNIGTCFDTYLSSLGGSKEGKKVAYAHILLNVGGALLFYPLLYPFSHWVSGFSSDVGQQLAHAQTLYNLVTSLFLLPFARGYARLIEWILRDRP